MFRVKIEVWVICEEKQGGTCRRRIKFKMKIEGF